MSVKTLSEVFGELVTGFTIIFHIINIISSSFVVIKGGCRGGPMYA